MDERYPLNGDFTKCHFRYDSSQEVVVGDTYENEWLLEADYGYIFTEDTPIFTRNRDGVEMSYKTVLGTSAWLLDNNSGYRVKLVVTTANTPPFKLTAQAIRDESVTFRTLNITNNVGGVASYEQKSANRFVLNLKDVETDKKVFIYYTDSSGKSANKEIPLTNGTGTVTFDTPNDNVKIDYFVIPVTYSDDLHYNVDGERPTEINVGETLNITLSSSSGFEFNPDLTVLKITHGISLTSKKFVLTENNTKASISYTTTANDKKLYVQAITREQVTPVKEINVTYDLTNCTSNIVANKLTVGETVNFTLTANNGALFKDYVPNLSYFDNYGNKTTEEFVISTDKKKAVLDSFVIPNYDITIYGDAQIYFVIPVTYSDDLHYNVDGERPTEINVGETLNITLSSSSGFEFNPDLTVLKITHGISLTSKKFVLTENNTKASISYTTTANDKKLYVQAITREQVTPVKEINVTYDLTNCTSNIVANKLTVGETVNFTLTANNGALFKDYVPNLSYFDNYGNKTTEEFVISTDKKKAVLDSFVIPNYDITIYGDAQIETTVIINYGAINAYIVNVDILNAFSNKRYFKESTSGNISYDVDLGEYVNRIKRIYLPISSTLNDVIRCGNYNTGIKCTDLPKDIYEINFGDIDIPLINGDSNDFNTGDLSIFIPFVGVVSLDNSLIGKTVNLVMKINAITGNGVSILSCNGVIFDTQNVVASTDVLFTGTNSNIYKIGGDDWNEQILMGIEPYVILNYTDSISAPINTTLENVTVKDVTGFAQFENVNLKATNLLVDEYNEIVSELETGVYL